MDSSYFKTVTSLQTQQDFSQKSRKPVNKEIKENEQIYYQAARDNYDLRQQQKYQTPLWQNTGLVNNNDKAFKPCVKPTEHNNTSSQIFDFTNQRREQEFRPHCIKVQEPGNNSDNVFKPQLKRVEQNTRNPITQGDPKSEYVRVQTGIHPKNQIFFG
ncbi:hypothetical protein pb186bvf_007504 [Paramecium bursaria]